MICSLFPKVFPIFLLSYEKYKNYMRGILLKHLVLTQIVPSEFPIEYLLRSIVNFTFLHDS